MSLLIWLSVSFVRETNLRGRRGYRGSNNFTGVVTSSLFSVFRKTNYLQLSVWPETHLYKITYLYRTVQISKNLNILPCFYWKIRESQIVQHFRPREGLQWFRFIFVIPRLVIVLVERHSHPFPLNVYLAQQLFRKSIPFALCTVSLTSSFPPAVETLQHISE